MPSAASVVRPTDASECAAALRDAADSRRSVRVRGAGTKDHLGDVRATDVVLETLGLEGVVDHVPGDLTVTIRAGTRLAVLQAALAAKGQWLPIDPPHAAAASVGGIIAANSNGFGRARYGGVRDLLIGTTTALADGTIARAGGRVVKNVAGYDLDKLLVGSLGTLGVIVEATFKVQPLAPARAVAVTRSRRPADLFARALAIVHSAVRPTALVVEGQVGAEWQLVVAAAGEPAEVDRVMRDASGERSGDPDAILEPLRELPARAQAGALIRAALPIAAQAAFAESAVRLAGYARLVADAASGIVRVHLRADDETVLAGAAALLAAARVVGGTAFIERREAGLATRLPGWTGEPAGAFLMRRIKAAFDPLRILEPGRSAVA